MALLVGSIPLFVAVTVAVHQTPTLFPAQLVQQLHPSVSDWIKMPGILVNVLAYSTLGALIVTRRPKNRVGWLFCAIGLFASAEGFPAYYALYTLWVQPGWLPGGLVAAWVQNWTWVVSNGLLVVFLPLLYPNGRLLSRRWRPVGWFSACALALEALGAAFHPGPLFNYLPLVNNPLGIEAPLHLFTLLGTIPFGLLLLTMPVAATSLLLRWRRARGEERQQIKWFAFFGAILAGLFVVQALVYYVLVISNPAFDVLWPIAWNIAAAGLPLATGLAILTYHLYAIDLIINRTLVYGALTASVVGVYILVVGSLGFVFQTSGNVLIALLATGLVAVLFQPVRDRLQRGVNRLLYGERDDPYTVLSRLGQRLESILVPGAVLPTLVETVRDALKLSYVAVALQQEETVTLAAAVGEPPEAPLTLPLSYQGEPLGHLLLGSRWRDEPFRPADHRLLGDLARQAGVAVYAARLTTDLQRSRERLVVAREEERRRLRRDLHDGLGPALSSQMLTLDAISRLLDRDSATARALLNELRAQSQVAFLDIRRLIYDLRPPALDDLGLVAALQESLAHYRQSGLECVVEVAAPLPALPAAVEVAVYRIAQEAVTNVARHSGARTCQVCLALTTSRQRRGLGLEVLDDGCGLPASFQAGVGLRSMRERAEELGGFQVIEGRSGGGIRVSTWLPVPEEDPCA